MCGIFGIIAKNERNFNDFVSTIVSQKKQIILTHLTPRGPDSCGEFRDEKCYLLSTRLKICDTSDIANQPYNSNGIILVFNGEIYNYIELRNQLKEKGIHFKTMSDTEVIVKLYEDEGLSFVDKLIGIFSLCVYDTKHKEVLLYRDRFGVKPLFYHENENVIIFSSDIPSILECVDDDCQKILPSSISSYLSFRNVIGTNTFYKKIKKLEPGYYMMIHRNVSSICEYWSLNPSNIDTVPDLYDSMAFLRDNLSNAIERNLPNENEINIFLSGGIDSSAIVYFADKLIKSEKYIGKTIKTYSIGFDNDNEFAYASIVADKFKTEHENIIVSTDDYIETMIDLIEFKGEPLNVPNEPLINMMSKHVKQNGNVVLSGEGADEILHGYGRLFVSYYNYLNDTSIPFYEYFMKKYSYIPEDYKRNIIKDDVWKMDLCDDELLRKTFEETFEKCGDIHNQDKIGFTMLKLHVPCLLSRLDNATMLSSVEGRVPFLDHDVVEYCFYRIQREHKIKLLRETSLSQLIEKPPEEVSEVIASPKFILKEMLNNDLPSDVISRKKVGFTVPLERILTEKYEVVSKILESGYINKMNIFTLSELSKRFVEQKLEKHDIFAIWMLMNIEIFAQLFIFKIPMCDVKAFFLVDPQYKYEKSKLIDNIIISRDEQLQRYIKLYIIKSLFEKYNIEYFAYGGTMLGCIRHSGFIPWDDDVDIMIMEDQTLKITDEFRMELLYAGFQIKKSSEGYKIFDYLDENFFVDVFLAQYITPERDTINYTSAYFLENFPGRVIKTDELYPLAKYDFGFFTLMGIKDPTNYFTRCNFGDYMNCATVSQLHNKRNNDILQSFLTKHSLNNLLIRDASLISHKDNVVYTDDWKQFFNRAKDFLPNDFNPYNYLILNKDLTPNKYSDFIELYIHYIKFGRKENRIYNIDSVLPIDFDVRGYRCLNPDLASLSDCELRAHYVTSGRNSKRIYNIRSLLPYDFDYETYAYLNPDLDGLNEDQLKYHYINNGKTEKRYYTKDGILPPDFDFKKYISLNTDLQLSKERETIIHYIIHGRKENRRYK